MATEVNLCEWCGEPVFMWKNHPCCEMHKRHDCPACIEACKLNIGHYRHQLHDEQAKLKRIQDRADLSR